MFDVEFNQFVTVTIVRFIWAAVLLIVVAGLGIQITMLTRSGFDPQQLMITGGAVLGAAAGLVMFRILLETAIILFRIDQHLQELLSVTQAQHSTIYHAHFGQSLPGAGGQGIG